MLPLLPPSFVDLRVCTCVCDSFGNVFFGRGRCGVVPFRGIFLATFRLLLQVTLLPFGAHFVLSCFSSLETYFLEVWYDAHHQCAKFMCLSFLSLGARGEWWADPLKLQLKETKNSSMKPEVSKTRRRHRRAVVRPFGPILQSTLRRIVAVLILICPYGDLYSSC